MKYGEILYEASGRTAILTINRPEVFNAMSAQTKAELEHAIDQIQKDSGIGGVILTGAGKAFSSGNDLAEKENYEVRETAILRVKEMHKLLEKIHNLGKPVIAAVNGFALGGGCELALVCDIRIASEKASFGLPEVTLGMIPSFGGTQRFPRLVGAGRAKEIMFTARRVKADEALSIGLVSQVVAPERLMDAAKEMMDQILKNGPLALMQCKRLIDQGAGMPLAEALQLETEGVDMILGTEDGKEGIRAFFEKRAPEFQGK